MTRKLLVGAIVAGALTVTAGTAFALSQNGQPTPSTSSPTSTTTTTSSSTTFPTSTSTSPTSSTPTSSGTAPAPGQLSADGAARIVQARMGGTVHEIEREVEHGRLEWKVEITAGDGITYDVRVDATTGDFTRVDQDDDRGRHGGRDDDDHDDDHDDD